MPRAYHPAVKASAAAQYASMLSNPIDPLAEEVGKAVAAEVHRFKVTVPKSVKPRIRPSVDLQQLEAAISQLVARVLDRLLSSPTPEGKAIRMALIAKLAQSEMHGAAVSDPQSVSVADMMLTTAEAAATLEVSRPYVSMLCDQGKLGEIVMTEGGHRRIRASAVEAYLAARTKQHEGVKSPREAAAEAGLYKIPDSHFTSAVHEDPPAFKITKTVAKTSRKRRA